MTTAPETLVMERVASIVDTEFDAEGFTTEYDRLGRSAGMEITEGARIAVAPDPNFPVTEAPQKTLVLQVPVTLQFYLAYEAEPDETIAVDPRVITGYGHRLREAFRANSSANSPQMWFLRLISIQYPPDPTGNASRLEARITGFAENAAGTPPA